MDCGARETCVVSATNVASCGDIEAPPTEIIPETRGGGAMDASTTTAVILSMDAGVVSTPALGSIGGQTLPSDGGAAIGMSTHDGGTLARDAGLRDAAMPLSDASIGGPTDTGLPSPFPRSDDATGVALRGPYTVGTYTDGLTSPLFTNPIIYYPMNATPPFAAVALAQTIATTRTHLMAWGPVLASHGIVAFLCDNNSPTENPPLRADALQGQINMLKAENTRADSPLRAKLDEARFGLFGWGMGGGGAFYVANRIPEKIRAFVALAPWISEMPTGSVFGFDRLTAATLILVASGDSVAPPEEHARFYYQRLSAAPRALGETVGTEPSPPFPPSETEPGRMVLAWFKLYLEGDARYETYFTGPRFTEIRSKFASFTSANR
jgi:dienelactone hydrolase